MKARDEQLKPLEPPANHDTAEWRQVQERVRSLMEQGHRDDAIRILQGELAYAGYDSRTLAEVGVDKWWSRQRRAAAPDEPESTPKAVPEH